MHMNQVLRGTKSSSLQYMSSLRGTKSSSLQYMSNSSCLLLSVDVMRQQQKH